MLAQKIVVLLAFCCIANALPTIMGTKEPSSGQAPAAYTPRDFRYQRIQTCYHGEKLEACQSGGEDHNSK